MTASRPGKYHGNKGLEYYRAYPRDFFDGTVGMPGQLKGFYRMVLDLIYMHDGFLLNDWGHIAGHTGFGKTQCRRMMADLVDRKKIIVSTENGEYFMQKRAVSELKLSRKFQEKQSNNAGKRWENNGLGDEVAQPPDIPPQDPKTPRPQDGGSVIDKSITPPPADGGGLSSQNFERLVDALGFPDPDHLPRAWEPDAPPIVAWLESGLSPLEIIAAAKDSRKIHREPPLTPQALDDAMQLATAAKKPVPKQPTPEETMNLAVEAIKSGKDYRCRGIPASLANYLVAAQKVTPEQCRAAGVSL